MRTIGILMCLILGSLETFGCNSCACASNTGTLGFGTHVDRNLVSFRYESRGITTTHPISLLNPNLDNHSYENIRRASVFGQIILKERVLLVADIPYLVNNQESELEGYTNKTNGFGDASIYAGWIQPVMEDSTKARSLKVRAVVGIKLPTGEDKGPNMAADLIAPAMQRGSGSMDLNMNLIFSSQLKKWFLTAQYSYWHNGKNKDGYRYGKVQFGQFEIARGFDISNVNVQPTGRVRIIHSGPNQWLGEDVELTGGYVLDAAPGIRLNIYSWMADANYYIPIRQNQAEDQIINENIWQFSLTRIIGK